MPQLGLEHWDDVKDAEDWGALLAGNGASIAVSPQFHYQSLYQAANLTQEDEALFQALGTTNFELVLRNLRSARLICAQLNHNDAEVAQRYDSVRDSLIAAVNAHHVAWLAVPDIRLMTVRAVLTEYRAVYTTNYDLLWYWAMNSGGVQYFDLGDCFWNPVRRFDVSNTVPHDADMTMVYWLHGALHLWRLRDGTTVKRSANDGPNLLTLLGVDYEGVDMPLFVSEGTADDKRRAIRNSDYLSHVYATFVRESEPLVVFGQGLDAQFDQHLIDAIATHPDRPLAFSVFPTTQHDVDLQKAQLVATFPNTPVQFFDSTTHSLGQ